MRKRKPFMITEHTILPDLLLEKKLYINRKTKELHEYDSYDMAFREFMQTADYTLVEDLEEIPNSKAAKILFTSNRQKLSKER